MSNAQAGTTSPAPENSAAGQEKQGEAVSGLNAQQQKEYMTLKQKAEEFNKLEEKAKTLEAQLAQAQRLIAGQGAGQATDPEAEDIAALREASAYDPVARQTLRNKAEALQARAEAWLAREVAGVPQAKRAQVEGLIRSNGYQIGATEALAMVTDPEAKSYQEQLAEAQKEIERLKSARPNGSSPATTPPASASADDDGAVKEMTWAEYNAALDRGGQRALDLMQQVGTNKIKLVKG